MLSRIKNAARRFIGQSICWVCDADHIDDLLRDCLAQATQSAVDECEVESEDVIDAIVANHHVEPSDVIEAIVEAHEVDTDVISETIVDAIDLDDIAERVKDDIDGGEIRDRAVEQLYGEVKQDVVDGLIEDSEMQQEVANAVIEAIAKPEGAALRAVIVKAIADELIERAKQNIAKASGVADAR